MSIRIGYLLPTRERIMAEQPQAAPLLELAERAERLGFDFSLGRCTSEIARHWPTSARRWPNSVSRWLLTKPNRGSLPRLPPRELN